MKTNKYSMRFSSSIRSDKLKKILDELNIKYEYSVMLLYMFEFETTKDNFKKVCEALAIDDEDLIISYRE